MKSVWVICNSISVTDWARLPDTNILNVVLRCWRHLEYSEVSQIQFEGHLLTCDQRCLTCRTKTYLGLAQLSCHSTFTSPQMIKLCLFTFLNAEFYNDFKRTFALACALDLAALENIPSLSFRDVYRYQPGIMKLFSVLILIPKCLRCITGPSHYRTDPRSTLILSCSN